MCQIGYHNCQNCGCELPCYLPDEECDTTRVCEQCLMWEEELLHEEEAKADRIKHDYLEWEALIHEKKDI